jgi:hypothetical protein
MSALSYKIPNLELDYCQTISFIFSFMFGLESWNTVEPVYYGHPRNRVMLSLKISNTSGVLLAGVPAEEVSAVMLSPFRKTVSNCLPPRHTYCNIDYIVLTFSSANATPEFEGRGGETLATEITSILMRAYNSASVLDLKSLCIIPGEQCWVLYIDVVVSFYFES